MLEFSTGDLFFLRPSLTAFVMGLVVLIFDVVMPRRSQVVSLGVTVFSLLMAMGVNFSIGSALVEPRLAFAGLLAADGFSVFANFVVLLSAMGALFIGHDYLKRVGVDVPEYNPLVLFAASGMMLLTSSNDLILLFISLEIMSISLYVLSAINRGDVRGVEGSLKYMVLGAFASAILLYGIAMTYGAVRTTRLDFIGEWLADGHTLGSSPLLAVGLALMLVGFGFKVASAPFHMWSPDVYQGAPTPVTAFMATGVKAASFAAFARVLFVGFLPAKEEWVMVLWALSALSIVWGNVAALVQSNLKRMLAYSSIGHAGYMLMALVAAPAGGLAENPRVGGLLFYLLTYTVMTVGAFAAVSMLTRDGEDDAQIDRLSGLASRQPLLAAGLSVCLLSLAGIPPTMGFVGKFYLFAAAVEGGYPGLAVVGAIGGAVGVYYYLRPIIGMYMMPASDDREQPAVNTPALGALALATGLVLVLGLFPGPVVDWARASILSLVGLAGS